MPTWDQFVLSSAIAHYIERTVLELLNCFIFVKTGLVIKYCKSDRKVKVEF